MNNNPDNNSDDNKDGIGIATEYLSPEYLDDDEDNDNNIGDDAMVSRYFQLDKLTEQQSVSYNNNHIIHDKDSMANSGSDSLLKINLTTLINANNSEKKQLPLQMMVNTVSESSHQKNRAVRIEVYEHDESEEGDEDSTSNSIDELTADNVTKGHSDNANDNSDDNAKENEQVFHLPFLNNLSNVSKKQQDRLAGDQEMLADAVKKIDQKNATKSKIPVKVERFNTKLATATTMRPLKNKDISIEIIINKNNSDIGKGSNEKDSKPIFSNFIDEHGKNKINIMDMALQESREEESIFHKRGISMSKMSTSQHSPNSSHAFSIFNSADNKIAESEQDSEVIEQLTNGNPEKRAVVYQNGTTINIAKKLGARQTTSTKVAAVTSYNEEQFEKSRVGDNPMTAYPQTKHSNKKTGESEVTIDKSDELANVVDSPIEQLEKGSSGGCCCNIL